MKDRCKICKSSIVNKKGGRRRQLCDNCRAKLQDSYRKKFKGG